MEKILKKLKKLLRLIFGRTTLGTLFLLIQILVLFAGFDWFREYLIYMYGGSAMLSALVLIYIISDEGNSTIKLSWVVPILIFPVFGTLFYLFLTLQPGTRRINRRIEEVGTKLRPYLLQDPEVLAHYESISASGGNLVRYMNQYGRFPAYENTGVRYFPLGDDMFPVLLEELKKAEHFIFMEYFIVEHGVMWDAILQVLETKASEGVEVRFMYDGMGNLFTLPHGYEKAMQEKGIQCKIFAPVRPALSSYQNNRDHRKICVIDGHTAFTGGVNLADEYINQQMRFGHWKDTGVRLCGEGVWNLTVMFLQMWSVITRTKTHLPAYGPYVYHPEEFENDGFVQPYGDSPLDGEVVGENVYLNVINQAKKYIYITTPYLIIDNEMMTALCLASKKGIDVRIITPGIPDKKLVFLLTRSYYRQLLEAGVRIYEYTPGFIHAKSFVCDDEIAVVGTINLDYRSLYLHFECGIFVYDNPVVHKIEKDFQETLKKSCKVTASDIGNTGIFMRICGRVLRLIAPLM